MRGVSPLYSTIYIDVHGLGTVPRYAQGIDSKIGQRVQKAKMPYFRSNERLRHRAYHDAIFHAQSLERALDAQHALCTLWLTVWYR